MSLTKKQLNSIKNAKTNDKAYKAFDVIRKLAYKEYYAIKVSAWEVYQNWQPPKDKNERL